jgi:type I restriction enzyme S subunit
MKFRETTLGEISGGGSYGLGASSTTDSTGPKFLRTTDIVSGTIDWSHVPYCSADSVTIAKYKLFHEDIVISRTGANAGLNCLVLAPPKNAIFAGYLVRFQINRELADARYVSYVLRSSLWKDYVEVTRTGSAQPQFNAVLMSQFPISLPSLNTQKAISTLLGALDAKIAVNNGLSKTLEDIAQAIFKSWFIDFDPVKAKMAGEKTAGMDAATAALFPESMEESELGLIPRGWEVRNIGSLCETLLGGTPSRKRDDFWGGAIPWINSGKVNDFRICTPSEFITELGLEKSATKLLPKGTTVLAITGATLGQFSRLEFDTCANQSVVGILGSANASNEFVFLSIKNGIQRLISAQTGGAQQHINKEDVNAFPIVYPGKALMDAFTNSVEGMFSEIGVLLNQSNSLTEIRDALLPRLISGELQIPEEMLAS